MRKLKTLGLTFWSIVLGDAVALAQVPGPDQPPVELPPEAAGACAACGVLGFIVAASIFVINILILVWVYRDAKARGMENPVLWLLLVFFTSIIGLIVYLIVRPKETPSGGAGGAGGGEGTEGPEGS